MADDDDRIEKYKDDMHDPTVDGDDIEIAPDGRPVFRSIGVIWFDTVLARRVVVPVRLKFAESFYSNKIKTKNWLLF